MSATYFNLWNAAKGVFREEMITFNAQIKKEERSQFNNLSFHHNWEKRGKKSKQKKGNKE